MCAARMLSGGRHSASKEWPSRWRRRAAGRSATSGRTLQMVPVSTMNYCLLSSSCLKIMPPLRVFSSRQLLHFPGSAGARACTFSPGRRMYCDSNRCLCHSCTGPGSSGSCAPGGTASGVPVVGRGLPAAAAGVDGRLIVCVDGGDCVAPPPAVQHVCVLRHLGAILEVFRNNVVYHVRGEAEEEGGHEACAWVGVRGQQGLHLPHF
jgi:hypothetical protein